MGETLRVLIVEDCEMDSELVVLELRRGGYTIQHQRVETAAAMNELLHNQSWDIIISDYNMPKFSAPAALALLKQHQLDHPFIIVSGSIGEDLAVEAIKNGAHDCIMKNNIARLLPAVKRALREARVRYERKSAVDALRIRATQQAAVAKLGQEALQGISLENLMDKTAKLVAKTLEVELCEILELLSKESVLLLRAGEGWTKGYVGKATVSSGKESQAGYTLLMGEPVVVEDLPTENRFKGSPLLYAHNVVSGLSVIIHGLERSFGVLGVHTTKRRKFGKDDVHFMIAIANILSTAIERKRSEDALRKANSELVKSRAILQDLATHDELTGLYNRRELFRILKEEVDRAQRYKRSLTLLMIDLDHFKQVNDKYGHQTGDEILRLFAQVVSENVRHVDRPARYGGEEFAILLPEISHNKALEFAERLCRIVSAEPFLIPQEKDDPYEIPLTISIGIASYPEDANSLDDLISRTDQMLYEAKRQGRNRVIHYKGNLVQ
jgi:diguanylate cyclase (GGDEF)-like protein